MSISAAVGRVASIEKPCTKSAMACVGSQAPSLASAGTMLIQSLSAPRASSVAPARDHKGFIVEPEPAVLLQHFARRIEIAAVGHDLAQPVILDLRDVDRGIPGCEQRRGADRAGQLGWQRVHVVAE